ncbi:MAG: TetR/AcrR family transcriptional regulator [Acidimicrobiia bacterium]|nr:TetR/AcrR family transcriptional regulator [Acidimicrobiia bacterium]
MARRPRGQLKEMILDATDQLLFSTRGVGAVSIDAVVEAVGCTPPALYHYFPTKEKLIFEAGQRQYRRFAADLQTSLPDTDDPLVELRARGHAYLDWGIQHPEHYRILFMTPYPPPTEDEAIDPSNAHGLKELFDNLARAVDAGRMSPADPWETALAFWSIVHGITALAIINPFIPRDFTHATLATTSEALIRRYAP